MRKSGGMKAAIRYSEAFKMEMVRLVEQEGLNCNEIRRRYGIGGGGVVEGWVRRYGNGTLGKVIRVQKPEEIDQAEQLKRRVRALERALADSNIDLALERQYTRLACQRAGIQDVTKFKKKAAGKLRTER